MTISGLCEGDRMFARYGSVESPLMLSPDGQTRFFIRKTGLFDVYSKSQRKSPWILFTGTKENEPLFQYYLEINVRQISCAALETLQ